MRASDITAALDDIGKKYTRQVKAEERSPSARRYRNSMWAAPARTPLKEIVYQGLPEAWSKASGGGRLPTHWRQVFYVVRPMCDGHPESDRPLRDTTFKQILEDYLAEYHPGWDVLRGARGVFKEPHAAENDNGLALSTMNVRNYLNAPRLSTDLAHLPKRFPTSGAANRIAGVLVCEKEGFDELLQAEQIPERYDLALLSTKGISALAARDLAASISAPCFTLHDFDKNGFVMASGFAGFATDLGIRIDDIEEWGLSPEDQPHGNPAKAAQNLRRNGATPAEAEFIASGQRVELNMFTGDDFLQFVEGKLQEQGVEKVIPDTPTLEIAWTRAIRTNRVNLTIDDKPVDRGAAIPPAPGDLEEQIRGAFEDDDTQSWDEALWDIACEADAPEDDEGEATE